MYRLRSMFKGMQNGCGCVQASRPSGMHTVRSLHQGLSQGRNPLPVYGEIILLLLLKGDFNHENKQKISYYFNTLIAPLKLSTDASQTCSINSS
jgi:hypothetical protein